MEEEKPKRKKSDLTPPPLAQVEGAPREKAVVYFTSERWKGVKTVFKCAKCGTFRDERDAMIEHVLLHYPKDEQEKIFDQLVKE